MYKNQPFMFTNNTGNECLLFCEADKTITLNYGNDYQITPWKVALEIEGVKKEIELPTGVEGYGNVVIECNPHIVVTEGVPALFYVAGFLLTKQSPITYYLCSLETNWDFNSFTKMKIYKRTFSGCLVGGKLVTSGDGGKLFVNNVPYSAFANINFIYRIVTIFDDDKHFLITAKVASGDQISLIVTNDLRSYCVLKNQANKDMYKCSILKNKIIYTVKNATNSLIEDRSLVTEDIDEDAVRNFIPTKIKRYVRATQTTPQVSEYAKAETYNALHGGAPDNVIAERLKICGGCEFRSTTYKGATDPDNFGWCTKCGCGNNPRALLVTKARLAQVSCPLTPPRWEKVEGVGGSVASVVDSVKGVAQSIKHLLTGNKDTPPSVS